MEWEICTQRRVTRIFLVKNLKYFSIRLFLFQNNSKFFRRATTFYHRPPEKSCSFNHTRLLPPKIVPHNKYAYTKSKNQTIVYFMQSTIKKAHPTKIQEIQPADNFFLDKCKFFSLLFKLLKSRNLSSSLLWYSNSTCDSLLDWCNSYHFKPKDQNLNSHLSPLFISCRRSGEKLIKYQANSSCVIMSVILMTTLFYKALILHGEIWCW